jgi:hypothetical protein
VAYGGAFPSVDMEGRPLTGARAAKAGSKIHGGPYSLASIRWGVLNIEFSIYINVFCT